MTVAVSAVLIFLLAAAVFAGAASAEHGIYGGKTAGVDGYGTSANPINITNEMDLYNLTTHSDDWTQSYYFILQNDLYLTNISSIETDLNQKSVTVTSETDGLLPLTYNWSTKTFDQPDWHPGYNESLIANGVSGPWYPIGNTSRWFKGTFDGNHYSINGLFINATSANQGLFGALGGSWSYTDTIIKNLTLNKSFVYSTGGNVGGLVGQTCWNQLYVDNCTLNECCVASTGGAVGGVVGNANSGSVYVQLSYVRLSECSIINSCNEVGTGGLVGSISTSWWGKTKANYCTVTDCCIASTGSWVGGMFGFSYCSQYDPVNCEIVNCNISGSDTVGGYTGGMSSSYSYTAYSNITNCNIVVTGGAVGGIIGGVYGTSSGDIVYSYVKNCNITVGGTAGGLVGYADKIYIGESHVLHSNVLSRGAGVAGLIGAGVSATISHCEVADSCNVTGAYKVGGLIGGISTPTITNSSVIDSTLVSSNISSGQTMGGFAGASIQVTSNLNNNTLNNVTIKPNANPEYAYLFDTTIYPINSTNGIARLAQINLSKDNKVVNSVVLVESQGENTALEGFENIREEFNISVSNPDVTSIGANAFKNSYLTDLFDIGPLSSIDSAAFENCTNLTGGFYVPGAVVIASDAFDGTSNLKVIYANTTGLVLSANTAAVNITSLGSIDIPLGRFAVSGLSEPFMVVMRGSTPAEQFKNFSSGTYLPATGSWVVGNTYLAIWNTTIWNTTISLDPNGGVGDEQAVNITNGSSEFNTTIIPPTLSGYTFGGWYDDRDSGIEIIDSAGSLKAGVSGYTNAAGKWINPSPSLTLYANWTVHTYNVSFNNNTGSGTMDEQVFTYDVPQSLSANTFTKPGFNFAGWNATGASGTDVDYANGASVLNLTAVDDDTVTLYAVWTAVPPSPTPVPTQRPSSGGSSSQGTSTILQSAAPSAGSQISSESTAQYASYAVVSTSAADIAAIKTTDPVYAAEVEIKLSAASAAGIQLTNSKGAPALVNTNSGVSDANKVTFARVYDIHAANPNEKLTQVKVTVPKADVIASGLTTDDVTIYHFLESYDIWVPLDTLQITEDDTNYYYTAKTDGTSPFGVLIKKFDTAPAASQPQPTQTSASPVPFIGILAGLGAAAVFFGLRRT